jgi:asparagine synthase (glutamine-hydrolysing)
MVTYLPCDLLTKVDIASMANSLEVRCPFLDHSVVELAVRIPQGLKMRGWQAKYILKKAFADLLPPQILRRGKMGFGVPIAEWFRGELSGYLREVLLDSAALGRGYFRPEAVRHMVEEHIARRADHGYKLWALLMLELWHRQFM